jgi:hypothetical protein
MKGSIVVKHKKPLKTYTYKCIMTGSSFKTTRQAPNPQELMTVDAYYDMHPENDDRPEVEKIKRKQEMEAEAKMKALLGDEADAQGDEENPAPAETPRRGSHTDHHRRR